MLCFICLTGPEFPSLVLLYMRLHTEVGLLQIRCHDLSNRSALFRHIQVAGQKCTALLAALQICYSRCTSVVLDAHLAFAVQRWSSIVVFAWSCRHFLSIPVRSCYLDLVGASLCDAQRLQVVLLPSPVRCAYAPCKDGLLGDLQLLVLSHGNTIVEGHVKRQAVGTIAFVGIVC